MRGGVHGKAKRAQKVKMGMNTVASDGTPLLVTIYGLSILLEDTNSVILTYNPLKRHGFHMEWKEGTKRDPHNGGYLITPDGRLIQTCFENDLWHLPSDNMPV